MSRYLPSWFIRPFPQNFIIRRPYKGVLILAFFTFFFMLLYRPLGTHPGRYFNYELTMALYVIMASLTSLGSIKLLKKIRYFSEEKKWNLLKELFSIFIILTITGIFMYFAAFFMEEPANRWNWPTFFNSVSSVFLVELIPFFFFTGMNLRFLWLDEQQLANTEIKEEKEKKIIISSRLKKEELGFLPSQLIYCESEGNYVNFYIQQNDEIRKEVIRNSISNIEEQFSGIPFLFRSHRAFIINLGKVKSKKGNSLGYRLQLSGVKEEIPVARNKTAEFVSRQKRLNAEED